MAMTSLFISVLSQFARSLNRWPWKWKGAKSPPYLADSHLKVTYLTMHWWLKKLDRRKMSILSTFTFSINYWNKYEKRHFREENLVLASKSHQKAFNLPNQRPFSLRFNQQNHTLCVRCPISIQLSARVLGIRRLLSRRSGDQLDQCPLLIYVGQPKLRYWVLLLIDMLGTSKNIS